MDADFNMIPEIFDGVESIGCITFTGGEPSLNHEFITACVDYIEKKDIYVGGVFIATNVIARNSLMLFAGCGCVI